MPDPMRIAADALAWLLIALPDLEALIETGHAPDDLQFIRELVARARRFREIT